METKIFNILMNLSLQFCERLGSDCVFDVMRRVRLWLFGYVERKAMNKRGDAWMWKKEMKEMDRENYSGLSV